jgi:hypothetical protein
MRTSSGFIPYNMPVYPGALRIARCPRINRLSPTCTERKPLIESADGRVVTVVVHSAGEKTLSNEETNRLDSDRPFHGRR